MKPLDWRLYPTHPGNFSLLLLPVPDYIFITLTLIMAFLALLSAGSVGGCTDKKEN
jgi:hypothetical protein